MFDEIVTYNPDGGHTVLVDYLCPLKARPSDVRGESHIDSATKCGGRVVVPEDFLVDSIKELHANATAGCKQRLDQLALDLLSDANHIQLKLRREDLDLVIRCCASLIELTKGMVAALAVMPQASELMQAAVKQVVELVSELPPVLDTLREQRDGAGGWAP